MRHISIIGIGAGDPDHLTLQAVRAIAESEVFFLFDKGADKAQLTQVRQSVIEAGRNGKPYRLVWGDSPDWSSRGGNYPAIVDDLNKRKSALTGALVAEALAADQRGAILVWGDPALYDSTIRIVEGIAASCDDLSWSVIPGISSIQALAARHRLTLNTIGGSVEITTGRRLAAGMPAADTVVVMLDAHGGFRNLVGQGLTIHYGAYVGMPQEQLYAGPLDALADTIEAYRQAARERHGWIMDCYMLRREPPCAGQQSMSS